jgi:hypothetical protein
MFTSIEPPENALAPKQVRFLDVKVEPWPDGKRVRVHLSLTPFKQNPNVEVSIENGTGDEVASTTIIESMTPRLVFTMHLRTNNLAGAFILQARLAYPDLGIVDRASITFNVFQAPEK